METNIEKTPLQARIEEVAQYEANIALYQGILANLPTEWPDHLKKYQGVKDQHQAISEVDSSDVELISELWYADECLKAIKTETLELTKAKSILKVLQA